jgi:hypothetical protein
MLAGFEAGTVGLGGKAMFPMNSKAIKKLQSRYFSNGLEEAWTKIKKNETDLLISSADSRFRSTFDKILPLYVHTFS